MFSFLFFSFHSVVFFFAVQWTKPRETQTEPAHYVKVIRPSVACIVGFTVLVVIIKKSNHF